MKITLFMAISINGFVADESGSEDFISHENWDTFCRLAQEYGNFIIGRKTYDAVKNWGADYGFDDLKTASKVILTHDEKLSLDGYVIAKSPEDALGILSAKGFKRALIGGGPTINSAFLKANLIDEIIFNIEPVAVGKGIPVFAPEGFQKELELVSMEKLPAGIIQVRYRMKAEH